MPDESETRVAAVRAFNRFWTARIGVLGARHLETPWSVTEARVLFELAQREAADVADVRRELGLDAGYLSRVLARFRAGGLVATGPSASDGRRQVARLTAKGRRAFATLDARAAADVRALLAPLRDEDQRELARAVHTVRALLDGGPRAAPAVVLRAPRAGDLGWVVERHGAVYAEEYGWNDEFEALVASIVAEYVRTRDPRKDAAWIAEVGGERAGSIFCVKKSERVAKLRLLLVEPRFRGLGVGSRLVEECVRFARHGGYRRVTLWTNDVLVDARRVYERAGFVLASSERHRSFGHELVGQHWELALEGDERAETAVRARGRGRRAER